jgi:hypothetical protein
MRHRAGRIDALRSCRDEGGREEDENHEHGGRDENGSAQPSEGNWFHAC